MEAGLKVHGTAFDWAKVEVQPEIKVNGEAPGEKKREPHTETILHLDGTIFDKMVAETEPALKVNATT